MSKLEELLRVFCPDGVEKCIIEDICDISRGRVMSKDYINENAGEYPVYSSQTENNGQLGMISTYDFDGEYLTWTTDGANAGTVFHRQGRFSVTNVCGLLKIKVTNVLTKYLYYILNAEAPFYVNQGMGNPKLMSNVMSRIKIFIPPLPVQSEIVYILDNFTEIISELIIELKARKKQYEYYASQLIIGKISEKTYEKVALGDIANFTYGFTDKAIDSGTARFIRITDIGENGCLKQEDTKYIELTEESEKYLLKKGDLLMARTGATYGKTLYMPNDEPSVYASFLIKITFHQNKMLNKFYWHFTRTQLYWEQANKLVSTGGQPQFNTAAISRVMVPIPSLEDQKRIVDILDRFDTLCNDISIGLPAEINARQKQYEYYRNKLLTFKELS